MPTEQEMQAQIEKLNQEKAALENKVTVLSTGAADFESLQKQNQDLSAKTAALEAESKAFKLEREKEAVLKEFPDALAFSDMVNGGSREEMAIKAKSISERVIAQKKQAADEAQKNMEAAWGKVNPGSSNFGLKEEDRQKKYEDSKKAGNLFEMMKHKIENTFRPKTARV